MERKITSGIILALLSISLLASTFNLQTAMASSTVYIRADGSVDPPTANIASVDNDTYTFTGNINDSIVVERNDIVVDGAGYVLQGTGVGTGLDLSGIYNVTVENVEVREFNIGIFISSSIISVSGNDIISNMWGIYLDGSENQFYHNNFIDNTNHASVVPDNVNFWDDGYPSSGNYWSDYTDVDDNSGPFQNVTGSDGIWDNPYVIDTGNRDNYPLVQLWSTEDKTPPAIAIISPENKTYATVSVPLTFTVDEVTSWMGYSLDDGGNVTVTGNITLTGLSDGLHSIIVYANDTAGNIGASLIVYFSIDTTKFWSKIEIITYFSLYIGSSVDIIGNIGFQVNPTFDFSANVTISIMSDGSWSTLATVTTFSGGAYTYAWKPTSLGSYQLKASWEGDDTYVGATSEVDTVTVIKAPTRIEFGFPREVPDLGELKEIERIVETENFTVQGFIARVKPGGYGARLRLAGINVTLTFIAKRASLFAMGEDLVYNFTRFVETSSDGNFSYRDTPSSWRIPEYIRQGWWSVTASWGGNSRYEGASSDDIRLAVSRVPGDCFIATATFGSELSPEVQFLRGFRENMVMPTFTGSSFLTLFNSIYYSFSPAVASVIASNEGLRSIAKVVLYPLMGILHIGVGAFSLFSFSPELGVVVFCLVVSSLIGIVYFTPLALLFNFLSKRAIYTGKTHLVGLVWPGSFIAMLAREEIFAEKKRLLSLVWAGSIAPLLVGEVANSPTLLMASGGCFVVTTAFMATLVTVRVVTKRYKHIQAQRRKW